MKSITKLLTLILVLALSFSFVACNNKNAEDNTTHGYTGYAFEYEEKKDDDGNNYYLITGLFVADGDATDVASGVHKGVALNIGANGEITVPVYETVNGEKKPTYYYGKLKTTTIKLDETYKYFEIADDAFANQLIIKSVVIDKCVTRIGVAAFAGCANIESMTVPFVGNEVSGVNASKTFANLFGSAEAANCTSVTTNYNESSTATYYIPNALKTIIVNFDGAAEVPAYAFYGLNSITKIQITGNVSKINKNAFTNCTELLKVELPESVVEIGKAAFSGCTSILTFDFASLANLTTIGQEAFSGCIGLGFGGKTIVMGEAVATLGYKAFYGCTSLKAVDLKNVSSIGYACFFNCSELKKVTHAATEVEGYAFENCHEDLEINGVKA